MAVSHAPNQNHAQLNALMQLLLLVECVRV